MMCVYVCACVHAVCSHSDRLFQLGGVCACYGWLIPLQVGIACASTQNVLGCVAMHVCGVNLSEPVRGHRACYMCAWT